MSRRRHLGFQIEALVCRACKDGQIGLLPVSAKCEKCGAAMEFMMLREVPKRQ
jgi:uncharacterized protein (DUF983 family)